MKTIPFQDQFSNTLILHQVKTKENITMTEVLISIDFYDFISARRIFNSLLGVWKCDETLSLVFDTFNYIIINNTGWNYYAKIGC